MTQSEEQAKAQEECVNLGIVAGAKAGAWALGVSGTLVGLSNTFWPAFRGALGVSGKAALIVSTPPRTHL